MSTPRAKNTSKNIIDVAIVGGGCAGLYCAWRIITDSGKKSWKPYVFEKENQVGGRLISIDLFSTLIPNSFQTKGRKAELGGMRFTEKQLIIKALAEKLRQEIQVESDPLLRVPYEFKTSLMYLREQHIDNNLLKQPKKLPYESLKNTTYKISEVSVNITKNAIREMLKFMLDSKPQVNSGWRDSIQTLLRINGLSENLKKETLPASKWREWQEEAKIWGEHIFSFGFWTLIHKVTQKSFESNGNNGLKMDTVNFLRDSLGYQSLITETNAAQAIPVFLADFDDPTYFTLSGGMDTLPRLLALKCEERFSISRRHVVKSIELVQNKNTKYFKLEGELRNSDENVDDELFFPTTHYAKTVILALPKDALKQINFVGFPQKELKKFKENIGRVTSYPACKLFLGYDKPWWYDGEKTSLEMRVITDLPIRQIYYYGSAEGKQSFIMGYSDAHFTNYWTDNSPQWNDEMRKIKALGISSIYTASPNIIDKAEIFLKRIHKKEPSKAIGGLVKKWDNAWHFWEPHTKPWKIAEELIQPFENVGLFTCGEAYSLEQGWVEGAFKSAERVLLKLGLKQWIDEHECKLYGYDSLEEYISH